MQISGIATYVVVGIVAVVALCGGVLVIVHPETLSFQQYSDDLQKLAVGVGLLGVGRGIAHHGLSVGKRH